jgi:hypothetical protein
MAEKTIGELMIDSIVAGRTRQDEKHFAELGQLIVAHAHAEASILREPWAYKPTPNDVRNRKNRPVKAKKDLTKEA